VERGTKGSKRGTARGARGSWEEGKKKPRHVYMQL
jgi:hypothetical protein